MNQSTVASLLAGIFAVAGVAGITTQDVSGFVNVIFGLVTIGGILWAHVAHKNELGRALGRY